MSGSHTCPHCGTRLLEGILGGLCPKCVVRVGLSPAGVEDTLGPKPSVPQELPPGSARVKYFGDYEVLAEVACGGMGIVFKARQVSLNRVVALKMLLHGALASEEGVRRFHAEAEAAASLQHPNIVAIHEIGTHEGLHYFSMDYVEGPSLDLLVRDGPLGPERAARYVRLIAQAVHYAHEHGVLHRDLKPSNVLIDRSDQPRLTDFGLAKRLATDSDLTLTGQILGSVGYMSPEQAGGPRGEVGVPSDVFSLGAILYHLLTGRPPFEAETIPQTLVRLQTTEPESPRELNPSVPPDLETICMKCLRKLPGERYESAALLAEDLERWESGKPILARRSGLAHRVSLYCRRHSALTWLAVICCVGALATFLSWPTTPPLRIPSNVTELIVIADNAEAPRRLTITDPAGASWRALPIESVLMDISPDGRKICFVREDGPSDSSLWLSELNGGGQRLLVPHATKPVWLNDRTVMYQPRDHLSLWAIDLASHQSRKLFDWSAITPRGHAGEVVPSPDGQRLLVNPQNGAMAHRADVYVCDLDGGNVRVVWEDNEVQSDPDSGTADHCLVWLNTNQVAWCRHARPGNRVFDMGIVTCRLGETNIQALTAWKGINYPLAQSPDGKRLLYLTEDSPGLGSLELWTMNTDGTERTKVLARKFGADLTVNARWIRRPQ